MRGLTVFVCFAFLALVIGLIPWPVHSGPVVLGERFPGRTNLRPGQGASEAIFEKQNDLAGVASTRQGQDRLIGQAWGDFDQDGWQDLYVTDPRGPNLLYRNLGNGSFTVMDESVIDPLRSSLSSGAVFADYDNDGYPDLYVLNRNQPNVLFHNQQGRYFVDITQAAGVGDRKDGKTASWGDYDQDGYLDLYVANWSCYPDCARPLLGDADVLYHNNGDGTFANVTRLLSSKVEGAGFVASFIDYDNDGDADIYLVNDVFINEVGNALWRNDGPGCDGWCFTEISEEAGADTRLMGMGLATTDYDNDGDIDLYFSNAGPMVLLRNLGNGRFADVAGSAGVDVGGKGIAWGSVSLDYDNDGFQDLYLALTDMLPDGAPLNPLFHNLGDGTFENVSSSSGVGHTGRTLGVASADYDRDGWIDIVIGDYERGYSLFRNAYAARNNHARIAVRLIGAGPVNRDAVGARVLVHTRDGRTQMQEVQTGSSLGGGNSLVLTFGLGRSSVESIEIRWPDGKIQTYPALAENREYVFRYDEDKIEREELEAGFYVPLIILVLGAIFGVAVQTSRAPIETYR